MIRKSADPTSSDACLPLSYTPAHTGYDHGEVLKTLAGRCRAGTEREAADGGDYSEVRHIRRAGRQAEVERQRLYLSQRAQKEAAVTGNFLE